VQNHTISKKIGGKSAIKHKWCAKSERRQKDREQNRSKKEGVQNRTISKR